MSNEPPPNRPADAKPLRRVIKVGGSLFRLPLWHLAVVNWIDRQPPACDAIVVGGGHWVDQIRRLDRLLRLGDAASHHLAIAMMDVNATIFARRVGWPIGPAAGDWNFTRQVVAMGSTLDSLTLDSLTLDSLTLDSPTIDSPTIEGKRIDGKWIDGKWIDGKRIDGERIEKRMPIELPASWDVTSDSLAAWIALVTLADELVLLKSHAPPSVDPCRWGGEGYVDPYFEKLVGGIPQVRAAAIDGNG